ncbi:MAG: single-stranded DNA-binding protein [Bacillota bacterium]|nr:single-stranded DNA-binding protein [Bacillota bacterium]
MNYVILIGRLTKDNDLKFTPGKGTAVISSTLAVDKFVDGQKQADFINIVIWGKAAETVANYTQKGSMIALQGNIQTRSYEAKDGTKRYVTEVHTSQIQLLGSKNNGSNQTTSDPFAQHANSFEEDMTPVDDGDIPF